MQNKIIRFCLQLDKMFRICVKEFLELNWLNIHDSYLQFIISDIFKFYNNQCPDYFNEVFCPVGNNEVATCCCNKKLKLCFRKSKLGMQSLLYVGPSTWKKLPNNLKTANSVNCFKHDIKKYFLSLKQLGWGQFDPPWGFSKNVSSKERVKCWFFVTFNIISHIIPENFIEIPQVIQKI